MLQKAKDFINSEHLESFILLGSTKDDRIITICHNTDIIKAMVMLSELPEQYIETYLRLREEIKEWKLKNTSNVSLN